MPWRLLEVGEKTVIGDEVWLAGQRAWRRIRLPGDTVIATDPPIRRRELKITHGR